MVFLEKKHTNSYKKMRRKLGQKIYLYESLSKDSLINKKISNKEFKENV